MSRNIGQFYLKMSDYHWHILQVIRGIILALIMVSGSALANDSDYKLKAAYIYQFTKFTHWPKSAFEDVNASIHICVLGKNPFGNSLKSFSGRKSQNRNLQVEYYKLIENVDNCHVVYISKSEQNKLPVILKHLSKVPVLSVSDIENFAQRGGIVGFVAKKRKVGIEINVGSSRLADLSLSSKLLEVAKLIDEKHLEETP